MEQGSAPFLQTVRLEVRARPWPPPQPPPQPPPLLSEMDAVWSPHPSSVAAAGLITDKDPEACRDKWELWEHVTGEKVSRGGGG